ncbi:hypothetical protein DXG01_002579 [Tephrocybe rancida]|nr:hypothetical protein DXG01_002579 [Tephrocybe rancida]
MESIPEPLLLLSATSLIGSSSESVITGSDDRPPAIANFLDALVAFFPHVAATVAAHSLSAAECNMPHPSPVEILHNVWSLGPKLCQSTSAVDDLTQYLLKIHACAIQETFQQGIENCEKVWSTLSARRWRTPTPQTFVEISKKVLHCVKSFCESQNVEDLARRLPTLMHLYERHLQGLLEGELFLLDMAAPPCFSVRIYFDELFTPLRRISLIISTLQSSTFQRLSTLPIHVTCISNLPPSPPPFANYTSSESLVTAFYRDNYAPTSHHDDQDIAEAIEYHVSTTLWELANTSMHVASQPHSESLLIQYHHLSKSSEAPFPYIGVSRPSCLQCRLYIKAYNTHSEKVTPYSVQGRFCDIDFQSRKVGAYTLPGTTKELDSLIGKQLRVWIRDIVTHVVDIKVKGIERRRKRILSCPSQY